MSLVAKAFVVAFIFVILLGTIVMVGIQQHKTPDDAAYYVANSTLNQTEGVINNWSAPSIDILGDVALLAVVFLLGSGFMIAAVVASKKRRG